MGCKTIEVLRGPQGPVGPMGPQGPPGGYLVKKITLTASQIKTLFSIPVLAVISPGAGYALKAIGFDVRYNYVSGGWSPISSNVIISNFSNSTNTNPTYQLINNVNVTNDTSNTFLIGYNDLSAGNSNLAENSPLYVKFDIEDSILLGTGTFDIYITYQILAL